MSGKPNKKWKDTMLTKFNGDEDALSEYMRSLGSKGGRLQNGGGYACQRVGKDGLTGPERARISGAKGGAISRRKKNLV